MPSWWADIDAIRTSRRASSGAGWGPGDRAVRAGPPAPDGGPCPHPPGSTPRSCSASGLAATSLAAMHRRFAIARLVEHELAALDAPGRASVLGYWWGVGDAPELAHLPADARAELFTASEASDPMAAHWDSVLRAALRGRYIGVINGYLEASLAALGIAAAVDGEVEPLHACPCCGYRTLDERGGYDICPVCFWEDDGVDDPAMGSGPNHMTLGEGRASFARIGAVSERERELVLPDGPSRYARG